MKTLSTVIAIALLLGGCANTQQAEVDPPWVKLTLPAPRPPKPVESLGSLLPRLEALCGQAAETGHGPYRLQEFRISDKTLWCQTDDDKQSFVVDFTPETLR